MKRSVIICAVLLCLCPSARADDTWLIEGQVVDEAGKPVADFDAATWWSANGRKWDAEGKWHWPQMDEEIAQVWSDEGVMLPWPARTAKKLGGGRFEIAIDGRPPARTVLVMDRQHERGGLAIFERDGQRQATIVLRPLVRVTGRITCSEAGRTPKWTCAVVHPPGDTGNWRHPMLCGSVHGVFSFLLPPGEYDVQIYSDDPDAGMPKPGERDDAPADMPPYLGGVRVNIPADQAAVDLGTFDVQLTRIGRLQLAGKWGDYTKCFGKEPPHIEFSDARSLAPDFQLSSLRGKWVLLDFWSLSCPACLANSLPELMKFYDEHHDQRGQFEIVSIFIDVDGTVKTVGDVDQAIESGAAESWHGGKLTLPLLVDHESQTRDNFGIWGVPTLLLVDPDGNLVDTRDQPPLDVLRSKLH